MKIVAIILALVFASGCQQERDLRIKTLEVRCAELEERVNVLEKNGAECRILITGNSGNVQALNARLDGVVLVVDHLTKEQSAELNRWATTSKALVDRGNELENRIDAVVDAVGLLAARNKKQ